MMEGNTARAYLIVFFVSYAQSSCSKWTDELLAQVVASDPHSPDPLRVNGPLANLPEFAQTFSCSATSKMVRPRSATSGSGRDAIFSS